MKENFDKVIKETKQTNTQLQTLNYNYKTSDKKSEDLNSLIKDTFHALEYKIVRLNEELKEEITSLKNRVRLRSGWRLKAIEGQRV